MEQVIACQFFEAVSLASMPNLHWTNRKNICMYLWKLASQVPIGNLMYHGSRGGGTNKAAGCLSRSARWLLTMRKCREMLWMPLIYTCRNQVEPTLFPPGGKLGQRERLVAGLSHVWLVKHCRLRMCI